MSGFYAMDTKGASAGFARRVLAVGFFSFFKGQLLICKIIQIRINIDGAIRTGGNASLTPVTAFVVDEDDAVRTLIDGIVRTGV